MRPSYTEHFRTNADGQILEESAFTESPFRRTKKREASLKGSLFSRSTFLLHRASIKDKGTPKNKCPSSLFQTTSRPEFLDGPNLRLLAHNAPKHNSGKALPSSIQINIRRRNENGY